MPEGSFKYWDDPLKHHVRMQSWLPLCRTRLKKIRQVRYHKSQTRRLRYFTFCATTAIDVLMLDIAGIVRPNPDQGFDLVTFFDYRPEDVVKTKKRIPGAVGFSGDFIKTVLFPALDDEEVVDDESNDALAPPREEEDKEEIHLGQVMKDQHTRFIQRFPFDVLNLDLEEFLFKSSDPHPGRVIRALKNVFRWQQKPFKIPQSGENQYLSEFSLMFTTQIGPPNIGEDYLQMLQNYLEKNLENFSGLGEILTKRVSHSNITQLRNEDFDLFFKLAMPKCLAKILMENDWYVDPERGIVIYEFERPIAKGGSYVMLHMVMDVRRKNPPFDRRDPGEDCSDAVDAYRDLTFRLFAQDSIKIADEQLDKDAIKESLDHITGRAEKYMSGDYS